MIIDDYFEKLCPRLWTLFGSPLIHKLKDKGVGPKEHPKTTLKLSSRSAADPSSLYYWPILCVGKGIFKKFLVSSTKFETLIVGIAQVLRVWER